MRMSSDLELAQRSLVSKRIRCVLTALVLASVVGFANPAVALKLGDRGPDVTTLQTLLQSAGYLNGPVDGTFGEMTRTALIAFQQANGLEADGVVGPRTQAALDQLRTDRRAVLEEGDEGTAVQELQNLLRNAGYFSEGSTGYFGPVTTAAVTRFQQAEGLPVDGVAGPLTLTALRGGRSQASRAASPPGTFQHGDSGDQVIDLQTRLRTLGFFNGAATGFYGPATEAAVVRFQEARGLTVDGVAGPATLAALGSGQAASSSSSDSGLLQRGVSGPAVIDLQRQLKNLGFYGGEATGFYGPTTEAAVIAFQQNQGLTADGVAGSQTLAALTAPSSTAPVVASPAAPQPAVPDPAPSSNLTGSANVLELQTRLQKLGFYSGPLDGIAGPQTDAAIRAAQEHYGITGSEIIYE